MKLTITTATICIAKFVLKSDFCQTFYIACDFRIRSKDLSSQAFLSSVKASK
jgi:hypothetical protein